MRKFSSLSQISSRQRIWWVGLEEWSSRWQRVERCALYFGDGMAKI